MAVQPTQPDRIGGSGIGRARRTPGETPESARSDRGPRHPLPLGDSIEISRTAEELHQVSSDFLAEASELSPERLQQVLNRIADGFYLRPEVRAEVARKLAKALGES
jgi:hypothetical protein